MTTIVIILVYIYIYYIKLRSFMTRNATYMQVLCSLGSALRRSPVTARPKAPEAVAPRAALPSLRARDTPCATRLTILIEIYLYLYICMTYMIYVIWIHSNGICFFHNKLMFRHRSAFSRSSLLELQAMTFCSPKPSSGNPAITAFFCKSRNNPGATSFHI